MHRTATRTFALAASILIPYVIGCGTGAANTGSGGTGGSGNGSSNGGSTGTSSGNPGQGGASPGSTGSGTPSTGSGSASTGSSGTASTGSSGTAATTSSGTASTGSSAASSSSGHTSTSSSSGASSGSSSASSAGGVIDAGTRACPLTTPNLIISDFEEDAEVVEAPFGSLTTSAWYTYNDATAGGSQSNTIEAANPGGTCDKFDLKATASGYPMYNGFGVTLDSTNIASSTAKKLPENLSAYDGIQFDIRSDGTNGPIFFEILNTQNQPTPSGTATNNAVDEFNTHGVLLNSSTSPSSVPITTSWQTVTIPFGILGPRYLPSGTTCTSGVFCEAPAFDPTTILGFQWSVVSQFTGSTGGYSVSVDNVKVMTSTDGTLGVAGYVPAYTQTAGAAKPFPLDAVLPSCTKPTGATGKFLISAYNHWKAHFVVASGANFRVQRPENNNDTVSEGIGYGMLIAANMNDQALFNGLWGYWKANTTGGTTLMNWDIPPGNNGSATDADEDAAFALLLASKQWGGGSATNMYMTAAQAMIKDIWTHDVDKGGAGQPMINGGSQFSGRVNPSYFAPAYYLAFSKVDTTAGDNWTTLITNVYAYLNAITNSVAKSGLVPAWCSNGCTQAGGGPTGSATESEYQYDAHRVPWRIGLDACWNGTANAKTYVALVAGTNGFFQTNSATTGLGSLGDIYMTSGTKDTANSKPNSMSLIGTMGVGAMAAGNAALALRAYHFVLDASYSPDPVGAVAAYTYFNATVGLMTALTMSGNFMSYP